MEYRNAQNCEGILQKDSNQIWQPNRLGLCQTILKLTSLVCNFQSMIFETVDTSFRNSQVISFVIKLSRQFSSKTEKKYGLIKCSSLYINQASYSLLTNLIICLFPVIQFKLRPDDSNFFRSPQKVLLSGVDCISLFIFPLFIRNAGWMTRIFFHTSPTETMGRKSWRLLKTW